MKRNVASILIAAFAFLVSFVLYGQISAEEETLQKPHKRFYRTGEVLKAGEILGLDSVDTGTVSRVSIGYNMIRSNLEIDWLYNSEVIGHTSLSKGLRKEVSFDYGKSLPGSIEMRFSGPAGQVQVTSVSAIVERYRDESSSVVSLQKGKLADLGTGKPTKQVLEQKKKDQYERAENKLKVSDQKIKIMEPEVWRTVATLDAGTRQIGSFWAGGLNKDRAIDDYLAGLDVSFLHLLLLPNQLRSELRFYVKSTAETKVMSVIMFLRGDRTGSRTYRLQIGYRPRQGYGGNEGGGTLSMKTWLGASGTQLNLGSVTYPTPALNRGEDAVLTSSSFTIGESDGVGDRSPYISFDLYAIATGRHMGGEINFVHLLQRR